MSVSKLSSVGLLQPVKEGIVAGSSLLGSLVGGMTDIGKYPTENALQKVVEDGLAMADSMAEHYPEHQQSQVNGLTYRFDSRSPEEIIEAGGFSPNGGRAYINGSVVRGPVSTTLLPEAAILFSQKKGGYLYTLPILQGYVLQGDKGEEWRNVALPSLPLPGFFMAKPIEAIEGGFAYLGALVGLSEEINQDLSVDDEALSQFASGEIKIPRDLSGGDPDYPAFYVIKDTNFSKRIFEQKEDEKDKGKVGLQLIS
ncbi:enterotoxin A family protein [Rickettsiales bacterium]|nr:enterotoxin A family protein [Rickettsiales bacterium]